MEIRSIFEIFYKLNALIRYLLKGFAKLIFGDIGVDAHNEIGQTIHGNIVKGHFCDRFDDSQDEKRRYRCYLNNVISANFLQNLVN